MFIRWQTLTAPSPTSPEPFPNMFEKFRSKPSEQVKQSAEYVAMFVPGNSFNLWSTALHEGSLDKNGIPTNLGIGAPYFLFTEAESNAFDSEDYRNRDDLLTDEEIKQNIYVIEFPSLDIIKKSTTVYLENLRINSEINIS